MTRLGRLHPPRRLGTVLAVLALLAAACGGSDSESSAEPGEGASAGAAGSGGSLNVAIVGNPQMEDIAELTPELFSEETGIAVNYTVLEEQALREIVTRDAGAGGQQFDVVMIGTYEAPQFGENGWLAGLNQYTEADEEYDVEDIFPTVREALSFDGEMYAAPFYAESSFLMYRQDVLDEAGIEMPEEPTWEEVADIARQVDSEEMAGICLRGKPGWGDMGAAFTTVLNTWGGTWWSAAEDGTIGEAMVDQPAFADALDFYVGLVNDAGQSDAANSSFNECLAQYQDGRVAMWYDATVAAGLLEAEDSDVAGLNGYVAAPVKETEASNWLWSWALAIPSNTQNADLAWEYVSWATGPQYLQSAGEELGWAAVPPGTRQSLYDTPEYQDAASAFADQTLAAIESAPIDNPGTTPRPGNPAVQFVGVPAFQDVGTRCTEQFSSVIAGSTPAEEALAACQDIAATAAQ